jgi:glycosyltransferase involved in cell wall biosynthesis
VPPGDARALADALASMLDDPAACRERARAAQAIVRQHFDIRTTVAELERLWRPRAG